LKEEVSHDNAGRKTRITQIYYEKFLTYDLLEDIKINASGFVG
jgi:hypothetical protein